MSFRSGGIAARVVCAFPMIVTQLLRRLLDLVECVAVHGVEQHVLKQREIDAWRMSINIVAVSLNQRVHTPEFVTWLQATVKR